MVLGAIAAALPKKRGGDVRQVNQNDDD